MNAQFLLHCLGGGWIGVVEACQLVAAGLFDALDMAEQRGLGFMTVRELPEKHNIPLPLVSYEEPYLVFTLPRNAAAVKKVDETLAELDEGEIRMLNFFKLNDGRPWGKGEVVDKLGIYPRTAERELKHLVDLGLLIREGVGRSTVYRLQHNKFGEKI